ncbi:hypothetical protein B0T11DRAFT_120740 [Plectosphaerella cucumerina]|uniref:NAD(P)-binding domain-containing protein n=1 Tax=Plectosphaerella cucumerina TaxID=40658 RepID=A0A8K0TBA0_9PEZI|nr:hypothetical protein B0T11DRAFT_120740 [Plectosphaerella cucumerina]
MSLRFTVVPASTGAGRATIRSLLSSKIPLTVHGIYRDVSKSPAEFTSYPNFTASTGDVSSGEGLDVSGSDAVLYVPPPPVSGTDLDEFSNRTAHHVKEALAEASVKRLVLISSMGSQYDREIGVLRLNHLSNKILENAAPEVVIVKPGLFQEQWAHVFETIKAHPPVIYSTVTPVDYKVPMVSVVDVGTYCARKLLEVGINLPTSPYYFDLYGPRNYSTEDIRAAVEEVTGKKVGIVAIEREDLAGFYAQRYPADQVSWMVDMTTAALPGGIMADDFVGNDSTVWAEEKLVSTLRRIYEGEV